MSDAVPQRDYYDLHINRDTSHLKDVTNHEDGHNPYEDLGYGDIFLI